MLHSRWINGNLAYWDTHQCRIIDAWGASVVKYINHFVSYAAGRHDPQPGRVEVGFRTRRTDSVTLPISLTGRRVQIACGAVDNNETYMQLGGATSATNAPWIIGGAAGIANTKPLYFGARVKCTHAR